MKRLIASSHPLLLRDGLAPLLVLLVLSACGTGLRNTLAQDLAWERWGQCSGKYPTIQLKEIRTDGQIFVWTYHGSDYALLQQCLKQAEQEQAKRGGVAIAKPSAAAVGSAPDTWAAPAWKPGHEWAYRWESPRGSGTFVWSVDRIEVLEGTRYYVVKSGQRREIFWRADDFSLYMDKLDGETELRRWPMDHRAPWPFRPGKSWDIKTTEFRPKERQTTDIHHTCRVESEETVRVPAGEFTAVKIVCRDGRTNGVRSEVWYAPAAKHWVRQRTYYDYGVQERELIGYRAD